MVCDGLHQPKKFWCTHSVIHTGLQFSPNKNGGENFLSMKHTDLEVSGETQNGWAQWKVVHSALYCLQLQKPCITFRPALHTGWPNLISSNLGSLTSRLILSNSATAWQIIVFQASLPKPDLKPDLPESLFNDLYQVPRWKYFRGLYENLSNWNVSQIRRGKSRIKIC